MSEFDVIVAGAGPAGLAAACLLALDGRRVALVAKEQGDASDPRTVALMQPSIRLLMHLGLWPGRLKDQTQPLKKLRLIDDTGALFKAPTITFDPVELGEEAFGWNFPLGVLIPRCSSGRANWASITVLMRRAPRLFRRGERDHHLGRAARRARGDRRGRAQLAAARGGRDPHQPLVL
jgi:2-polyprenyl-6-methoxyphenol hydroxylase-like FAD-dependent oxidoreductase